MARKNANRASQAMTLPRHINSRTLQGAVEHDPVFQENMRTAMARAASHKLDSNQLRSIRRDLVHRAVYRFCRKQNLPCALVPRLEALI